MYGMNIKASEQTGVLGAINPSSQAVGTLTTGWISAANYQKFLAIVQTGVLGAAATVDCNIQQALDGAGTGAKAIAGAAIAQLSGAGGANVQAEINLDAQQLDVEGGFGFINVSVIVGAAASQTSALLLGFAPRFAPVTNAATVAQVVG
ncbi:hypothetical protein SAMN04487785_102393 [Dyella jiangningensis]|nr:hypothetical protein BDW41_102392 [Dyella sp. AtDHG13]SDJ54309.1 hypothetical protein SAMN04487785_102393 [Dyella jiangningensis]